MTPAEPDFPVVVLVCSLGGAEALQQVLSPLPADFPAAIIALQHLDPRYASNLHERLNAVTYLTVREAVDGHVLRPGYVEVAPSGQHLLLASGDTLLLVNSLKRPSSRPSADLLLVSAAAVLGPRLLAVILTGTGDDGAVGAQVVTRYGGRTMVQDEATAASFGMPGATLAADSPGVPVALEDLAVAITARLMPGRSVETR
jgi:two-component system chemotaxis response regulator CheB